MFISHCVSRLETLDEKMRQKNPLNFVISPMDHVDESSVSTAWVSCGRIISDAYLYVGFDSKRTIPKVIKHLTSDENDFSRNSLNLVFK